MEKILGVKMFNCNHLICPPISPPPYITYVLLFVTEVLHANTALLNLKRNKPTKSVGNVLLKVMQYGYILTDKTVFYLILFQVSHETFSGITVHGLLSIILNHTYAFTHCSFLLFFSSRCMYVCSAMLCIIKQPITFC
jgi:hypothetical protein